MKRHAAWGLALALVIGLALPAFAGDAAKEVKLVGWVSDECCAAKNANAAGKACTLECHKNGSHLVFYSDGKTYKVADEKKLLEHVGHEIQVTGMVAEDGMLKIASIEASKKKA
jgi:hypothetical protein